MKLRIHQISLPLGYSDDALRREIARKVHCKADQLHNIRPLRRSLDARSRNPEPHHVLSVEVDADIPRRPRGHGIDVVKRTAPLPPAPPAPPRPARPVVVGAGPAGLMAAWTLAKAGARPILIERGDASEARAAKVHTFWKDGTLDPESNALFGEGGAGLFSDGKLTSRTKDRERLQQFFRLLVDCGADPDILIDAEPHIGSDVLQELSPMLRSRIEQAGGTIHFQTRLDELVLKDTQVQAVRCTGPDGPQEWATDTCILCVGHSARDTYAMLHRIGVRLEPKPFAMGVRLELPQSAIDRAQYGRFAGDARLGAANFRLTRRPEDDLRACYSFCMCPGGRVISCASEPGMMTTNGMSYSQRDMPMGNAAFLVPIAVTDYPTAEFPALAGIDFQRHWETLAYRAGNGDYITPASRLSDFLDQRAPADLPDGRSCPRSLPVRLDDILPEYVAHTLRHTIPPMLQTIHAPDPSEVLLYASETRSSSPVRIVRDDQGRSINTAGLYPAGEGAGYSGGIASSAIDGIRLAQSAL